MNIQKIPRLETLHPPTSDSDTTFSNVCRLSSKNGHCRPALCASICSKQYCLSHSAKHFHLAHLFLSHRTPEVREMVNFARPDSCPNVPTTSFGAHFGALLIFRQFYSRLFLPKLSTVIPAAVPFASIQLICVFYHGRRIFVILGASSRLLVHSRHPSQVTTHAAQF